jgi:uridine phosphorylase
MTFSSAQRFSVDAGTPERSAASLRLIRSSATRLRLVRGAVVRVATVPRRLRPTAEIYPDAILVGDPGRAMALAQVLLEQPKMSNHARGLWGYSGLTAEGRGLTVQSTGMGGPSAALVLGDLSGLGVRRAVRVGTCAALAPDLRPGDLVEVREARPWSIVGRGAGPATSPEEALADRLRAELESAARSGAAASLDVLHPSPGHPTPEGDVADMQTAALFKAGQDHGVALAAVLIVTEADRAEHLGDDELAERAAFAAAAATRALFG